MGSCCAQHQNKEQNVVEILNAPENYKQIGLKPIQEDMSATKIQATFRGYQERKRVRKLKQGTQSTSPKIEEHQISVSSDCPISHYPRPEYAVKLNQTPTDYALTVQKALYKLGPFKYNDYINSDDPLKQSQNYVLTEEDKKLPFLEPHRLQDGTIYIGQWKEGQKCGKGKQIWPDGSVYEGFWKDNKACGIGRLIHSNGDIYIGDWLNDKCSGYGQYTHINGTIYEGQWLDDKQNGYGEETYPDNSYYKGNFKDSLKHGQGEYYFADKSFYKGSFVQNAIEGRGVFKWPDGKIYDGEWENNAMHGYGEFKWPDGRIYRGQYSHDLKHGIGEFVFDDNTVYKGQWKDGKQDGEGMIITRDYSRHGIWRDGKRVYWKQ